MEINGSRYEGMWTKNVKNGKGKQIYPDGSIYTGTFVMGNRHGKG